MVYYDIDAIQLHIGKTGGTSIAKAFCLKYGDIVMLGKHWRPNKIIEVHGQEVWDKFFKFSFVRNPWDRLLSMYMWRRDFRRIIPEEMTYKEFLYDWAEKDIKWEQIYWFEDKLDQFDFVGRFENLASDFQHICDQLGIGEVPLPHIYRTNHGCYRECYDADMKDKLAEIAKKDIDAFGYEF